MNVAESKLGSKVVTVLAALQIRRNLLNMQRGWILDNASSVGPRHPAIGAPNSEPWQGSAAIFWEGLLNGLIAEFEPAEWLPTLPLGEYLRDVKVSRSAKWGRVAIAPVADRWYPSQLRQSDSAAQSAPGPCEMVSPYVPSCSNNARCCARDPD
jgi:hypothetical protein